MKVKRKSPFYTFKYWRKAYLIGEVVESETGWRYVQNRVLVSGGGTNLQAIIDAIENGKIKNGEIATVVSNKADAYALKGLKIIR